MATNLLLPAIANSEQTRANQRWLELTIREALLLDRRDIADFLFPYVAEPSKLLYRPFSPGSSGLNDRIKNNLIYLFKKHKYVLSKEELIQLLGRAYSEEDAVLSELVLYFVEKLPKLNKTTLDELVGASRWLPKTHEVLTLLADMVKTRL